MDKTNLIKTLTNKLEKAGILNDRISVKLLSLRKEDDIVCLVEKYFRIYKAIIKINKRCKKIKISFDLDTHLKNIDTYKKAYFDKLDLQVNKIELERKNEIAQTKKDAKKKLFKGSIKIVSGGLPGLGKRR
jgi:hypothetical protein